MTSLSFSANLGSLESLNVRTRCGWSPCPFQMRRTDEGLIPTALAIAGALQWVASCAPRSIPLGRIAECEEVASLATYLASDLAHFVNGTMIEIDGGQQKPLMDRFRDR